MGCDILKKFIGTKSFYKLLFIIVIPIILQQFITQFVGLVDNLMIGQVGDSEMTGVSLSNQLLFIYNLGIFGSLAGASIFASQYFGSRNKEGFHEAVRFKWLMALSIFILSTIIFVLFSEPLLKSFITSNDGDSTDPDIVLKTGKNYLMIMIIGNLPFAIKEIYATSLREMKETFFPMLSGVIAILINLLFNYLLIFGKFGFPELKVAGAAIATVISRFVEMILVIVYTHIKRKKYIFFTDTYKKIAIKKSSIKQFLPKSVLLLTNEILWSLGLTLILQSYSLRGLDTVASLNICNTVTNVFLTIGTALGNATAIIIGNMLGANKEKEAKESSLVILGFSVVITLFFSAIMLVCAYFVPNIYNASNHIKELATTLIIIGAIFLPFHSWNSCCYFTLRAGGKVLLTMFFDCIFVCLVRFPIIYILSKFTGLDIITVYIISNAIEASKSIAGYILVKKGIWLKTIV